MVSLRFLVAGAALMAAPIMAALTPAQIVDHVTTLKTKSEWALGPARQINIVNAPLLVVGSGPLVEVLRVYHVLLNDARAMISAQEGTAPITDATEATNIANAFGEFADMQSQVLNILIRKAGILQKLPLVGDPVATMLTAFDEEVDTIAAFLVSTVEPEAAVLQNEASNLSGLYDTCIQSWKSISVKKRSGGATIEAARPDARVFVA